MGADGGDRLRGTLAKAVGICGLQPGAASQVYWPRVSTTSTLLRDGADLDVCFKRWKLISRGLEQRAGSTGGIVGSA